MTCFVQAVTLSAWTEVTEIVPNGKDLLTNDLRPQTGRGQRGQQLPANKPASCRGNRWVVRMGGQSPREPPRRHQDGSHVKTLAARGPSGFRNCRAEAGQYLPRTLLPTEGPAAAPFCCCTFDLCRACDVLSSVRAPQREINYPHEAWFYGLAPQGSPQPSPTGLTRPRPRAHTAVGQLLTSLGGEGEAQFP